MSQVSLHSNRLSSSIPASWLALPTLVLDLGNNSLSGALPAPAPSNEVMRELLLGGNSLSGPVNASVERYVVCTTAVGCAGGGGRKGRGWDAVGGGVGGGACWYLVW